MNIEESTVHAAPDAQIVPFDTNASDLEESGNHQSETSIADGKCAKIKPIDPDARLKALIGDPKIATPASLQPFYTFVREMGHGAQGRIYLAIRKSDLEAVVIKQLNVGSVKTWKEYELFQREAQTLSALAGQGIDGVAQFYEAIECLEDDPPCAYIVQEYIEGESLKQMLAESHRFSVAEVYDIIIQILKILQHLHHRTPPIIHRDIKPSNIMLTPHDGGYHVTLIDFGAVANPQVQSGGSTVAGTYGYMPPEQLTGKPCPASDIYALGALAVELLSGKSPASMPTKNFRLIFEPELEQRPPQLLGTLRAMLEPKVEDRLTDIPALIDLFNQYIDNDYKYFIQNKENVDDIKEFNEGLKNVENIYADSNLKLWQFLDDSPGRKVPEAYIDYYYPLMNPKKNEADKKSLNKKKNRPRDIIRILITILINIFIGLFGFMLMLMFSFSLVTLIVLFVAITCMIMVDDWMKNLFKTDDDAQNRDEQLKSGDHQPKEILELICKGRKTMATIVGISYIPAKQIDMITPISSISTNKHTSVRGIVNQMPCFKIQYKFNPPDDAREEDLIHECCIHDDPEGHYQIGDVFPILYRIMNHGDNSEMVMSMPFPYPYETMTPDEIIGSSNCRKKVKQYARSRWILDNINRYRQGDVVIRLL